jgi:hypothetical protein
MLSTRWLWQTAQFAAYQSWDEGYVGSYQHISVRGKLLM